MSAIVKYLPFIFVKITCIGSMGQLHFDSSISELRYLASKTIFSDSPLTRNITGLMQVLPFGCSSLFTGDIVSYCSKYQVIYLPCRESELVLYLLLVF